jgi:repressor LexA
MSQHPSGHPTAEARYDSAELLGFLRRYLEDHGYAPSIEDIARGTGMRSKSTVAYHLDRLEAAGRIRRARGVARSLQLTGK